MILKLQPAWSTHLRSRARLRDRPRTHLVDPSLAAALGAVVEARDRTWGAVEVKLGTGQIDQAAAHLLRFAEKVDTTRVGEPAVLGAITANGYGLARPDGVVTTPIGTLGP